MRKWSNLKNLLRLGTCFALWWRKCAEPNCSNSTDISPKKSFIFVSWDLNMEKLWFMTVRCKNVKKYYFGVHNHRMVRTITKSISFALKLSTLKFYYNSFIKFLFIFIFFNIHFIVWNSRWWFTIFSFWQTYFSRDSKMDFRVVWSLCLQCLLTTTANEHLAM